MKHKFMKKALDKRGQREMKSNDPVVGLMDGDAVGEKDDFKKKNDEAPEGATPKGSNDKASLDMSSLMADEGSSKSGLRAKIAQFWRSKK